eukprot:2237638-Pleurochrysis_carterae.AAC.1
MQFRIGPKLCPPKFRPYPSIRCNPCAQTRLQALPRQHHPFLAPTPPKHTLCSHHNAATTRLLSRACPNHPLPHSHPLSSLSKVTPSNRLKQRIGYIGYLSFEATRLNMQRKRRCMDSRCAASSCRCVRSRPPRASNPHDLAVLANLRGCNTQHDAQRRSSHRACPPPSRLIPADYIKSSRSKVVHVEPRAR